VTGLVIVVAVVLRWVARVLIRVAEWCDPDPLWVESAEATGWAVEDDGPDSVVVPFYGRRRGA
jgi:hypothetical protein